METEEFGSVDREEGCHFIFCSTNSTVHSIWLMIFIVSITIYINICNRFKFNVFHFPLLVGKSHK